MGSNVLPTDRVDERLERPLTSLAPIASHGHASPAGDCSRHETRLDRDDCGADRARDHQVCSGAMSGAVGTYSATSPNFELMLKRLGLGLAAGANWNPLGIGCSCRTADEPEAGRRAGPRNDRTCTRHAHEIAGSSDVHVIVR